MDKSKGLYRKFNVSRVDGKDQPGGPKEGAEYFVIDIVNDPVAKVVLPPLIQAYAQAGYKALAADLIEKYEQVFGEPVKLEINA